MATDTLPATIPQRPAAMTRGASLSNVVETARHFGDLYYLAEGLFKSGMLKKEIRNPEGAVLIMLKGQDLGLSATQSLELIDIIQGKPVIPPQLMLALVERSGLMEDRQVVETVKPYSCTMTVKRVGRSPETASFDEEEARAMQLWGKDNYKKQPGVMLYWRTLAKLFRRVFPDVLGGFYTPDEMGATTNEEGEVIDAEVIEPEPVGQGKVMGVYSRTNPHPRNTGYGVGEFLPPDRNAEYERWAKSFIAKANEKWQDHWANRLESGQGLPDGIPQDLINWFRLTNHLMKWLRESKWIDPAEVREDLKNDHGPKYLSLVYHQSPEARVALRAEIKDYLGKVFALTCDAIYRKHPDLAPDGWAEEQEEARRQAEEEAGEDALDAALDARGQAATGIGSSPGDDKDSDGWDPGRE